MLDGWMNCRHYISTLYKYEKHIITSAYTPVCVCIYRYLSACVCFRVVMFDFYCAWRDIQSCKSLLLAYKIMNKISYDQMHSISISIN